MAGPASLIKSDGAIVIAVGIGKAKEEQIYEIASDPDNEFSTIVNNFEELPRAVSSITNQIKLCTVGFDGRTLRVRHFAVLIGSFRFLFTLGHSPIGFSVLSML